MRTIALAASVLVLAASVCAVRASQPSGERDPLARLPAVLQDAHVRPALYKTATAHGVTDAEYALLGIADRATIRVYGGFKVTVVSDARHGLGLIERSCCALQEWILFDAPGGVRGAKEADLGAVRIAGVAVGTPVGELRKRFGSTAPRSPGEAGAEAVRYLHRRNHDCWTYYTFVLRGRRVSAISVKNAC